MTEGREGKGREGQNVILWNGLAAVTSFAVLSFCTQFEQKLWFIKGVSKKMSIKDLLMFFITVYSILLPVSFFSVQVDECNISRNLGNNLSDSVHQFSAIAHGIKKKNGKNYKSSR